MPPVGELALIDRIRRATPTRGAAVALGIGDDCAILRPPRGHELVLTTDLCIEARHFRRDWHSPESAGHRCLARGLSDLAAMGARPLAAFLSLALPAGFDPAWLDGFLAGFHALAERFQVELAGGDTAQAPGEHILADVVLVGAVPTGKSLRRGTARPGDLVYVSGALGGSSVQLAALAAGAPCGPGRQAFPEPRLAVGQRLRGLATACIDLSDGLSTDLHHLCEASGAGAELDSTAIPLAAQATLEQARHGGEDYELLFTAAPGTRVPGTIAGVPIRRIGRIVPQPGIRLDANPLAPIGWEHFRSSL
jgi:thiamine-monophosphate kinase